MFLFDFYIIIFIELIKKYSIMKVISVFEKEVKILSAINQKKVIGGNDPVDTTTDEEAAERDRDNGRPKNN